MHLKHIQQYCGLFSTDCEVRGTFGVIQGLHPYLAETGAMEHNLLCHLRTVEEVLLGVRESSESSNASGKEFL